MLFLASKNQPESANILDLDGLDDDEINGYILSETEAVQKDRLWKQMNAEYLQLAKEREERAAKEREDGKPEKKKRRGKKKPIGPSSSAGEAIEKMLQEKKISSKINYDILKSLTAPTEKEEEPTKIVKTETITQVLPRAETLPRKAYVNLSKNRRSKAQIGLPIATSTSHEEKPEEIIEKEAPGKKFLNIINREFMQIFFTADEEEEEDILEPEDHPEEPARDDRLGNLLNKDDDDEETGYFGGEDYY